MGCDNGIPPLLNEALRDASGLLAIIATIQKHLFANNARSQTDTVAAGVNIFLNIVIE
jgi:hypothetical protein